MSNLKDTRYTTEIFHNQQNAEQAYQRALAQGYSPKDINVIMSEESRKKYYDSPLVLEEGDKSMEGLGIGGAAGGAIGGIVGAIAAIGSNLVIPGLGLVVAGPLAAGLAGAGAGSIAGGVMGTLIGWGISEPHVKEYESGIKSGGIVLMVNDTLPNSTLSDDWKNLNQIEHL